MKNINTLQKKYDMAIGIVLYNPEKDYINKLCEILEAGYDVFLYDNSSSAIKNSKINKFNYYHSPNNLGLASGMRHICIHAFNKGFKTLLYFDQDTQFTVETLDYTNKIQSSFFEANKRNYLAISMSEDKYLDKNVIDVKLLRNSGTIFLLDHLKLINWFDTSFFVDGVDYDFCLRAKLNKLKLGKFGSIPGFDHEINQGYSEYTLFKSKIIGRRYSQKRLTDIMSSTVKIVKKSISHFEIFFAVRILVLTFIFMIYQLILRIYRVT